MSGGAISGSLFLGKCLFNEPIAKELIISKGSEAEKIGEIKTLDDIEIFEKQNNCSFAFVHDKSNKKVYSARKYLSENKEKNRLGKIILAANDFKNKCKNGKIVTLSFGRSRFKLNKSIFNK